MTRKVLQFILLGFLSMADAYGQGTEGRNVLEKIRGAYQDMNAFEMHVVYQYSSKKGVLQSTEGDIKADGTLYFSKIGGQESLNTSKCFIHIDHDNKIINVFKPQKNKISDLVKIPTDSALNGVQSLMVDTLNNQGRLRVQYKENLPATHMELIYDLKTYHIVSTTYSMSDEKGNPVQLKVSFSLFTENVKHPKEVFEYNNILSFKGKNIVLTDRYKTYELNNYLNLDK